MSIFVNTLRSMFANFSAIVLIATMFVGTCRLSADELKVDFLFPAGASSGADTTITAKGTFDNWPVNVVSSDPKLLDTAAEKKGEFLAKVLADLSPGVYWLRIHDIAKASRLLPFIVGGITESREQEPNNSISDAKELTLPVVLNGQLSKSGEVDCSRVKLKKGQTLIVSVRANSILKSPMDGVIQLCDSKGFVLAQQDDEKGLDPQLVHSITEDGDYHIRIFAFPEKPNSSIQFSGAETYVYRMTATVGPFIDHVMPLALPKNSESQVQLHGWNLQQKQFLVNGKGDDWLTLGRQGVAGDFSLPMVEQGSVVIDNNKDPIEATIPIDVCGTIATGGDEHSIVFEAKKSEKLNIKVRSQVLGFVLDPVITIYSMDGTKLKELDDASKQRDPELVWTVPSDGKFRVGVKDLFGDAGLRFSYRLTVSRSIPDFQVGVKTDVFEFGSDGTLKIPVTLQRLAKFDQAITVQCVGLPDGIEAKPVELASATDANKELELILERKGQTEGLSSPFRIRATSADGRVHEAEFGKRTDRGPHSFLWIRASPTKK